MSRIALPEFANFGQKPIKRKISIDTILPASYNAGNLLTQLKVSFDEMLEIFKPKHCRNAAQCRELFIFADDSSLEYFDGQNHFKAHPPEKINDVLSFPNGVNPSPIILLQ